MYGEHVMIRNAKRVLITGYDRPLAHLGITIDPDVKVISILNAGANNLYFDYGVVNTGAPVLGTPVSPVLQPGDGIDLDVRGLDAAALRFSQGAAGTTEMNVYQKGGE